MNIDVLFQESEQSFDVDFGQIQEVNVGQNGATFYPTVSEDGILSWTNDRELENPKPVKIRGKDGYTPVKGVDYFDGNPGKDGHTPEKGTDYFTEADKQEIAQQAAQLVDIPEVELDGYVKTVNGVEPDENGNVEITIPEGGGTSVQADLAQNDPTQADYVKNRTHWVEREKVEVMAETTFTSQEQFNEVIPTIPQLGLVVGDTYTVKFNGAEYPCVAEVYDMQGVPLVRLVNDYLPLTLLADIPPEIAAIYGVNVYIQFGFVQYGYDYPVTMSISQNKEIVHKLDPKFYDRLAWEEKTYGELPVSGDWMEVDEGAYMYQINDPIGLAIGETYIVNWDGTEYEVVGVGDENGVAIGNLTEDADGVPFVLQEVPAEVAAEAGFYAMAAALDYSGGHTFTITGNAITVHKIDNKFIDKTWVGSAAKEAVAEDIQSASDATYQKVEENFSVPMVDLTSVLPTVKFDGEVITVPIDWETYRKMQNRPFLFKYKPIGTNIEYDALVNPTCMFMKNFATITAPVFVGSSGGDYRLGVIHLHYGFVSDYYLTLKSYLTDFVIGDMF